MMGSWQRVEIAGKLAEVYDLAEGIRPRFGILDLHAYNGICVARNTVWSKLFDELRLACVCPFGNHTWWADRVASDYDPQITAEQYLLQQVLPFFRSRWNLSPPSIAVTGISMGGQGALRLGFKYPQTFPVVAGIASAIEYEQCYGYGSLLDEMYDSKEQCRQDTAGLHINPSNYPPHILFSIDPDDHEWIRGNDRLHEKLQALGIPHQCDLTTREGGHSMRYFESRAEPTIRFVVSGLEQMSRRLM
jgi:S-formylglutathione hydrolase